MTAEGAGCSSRLGVNRLGASRGLPTRRPSVELFARRSDRRPVRLQPRHQPADRLHELFAQRRERVLDAGRHFGIDVAREQAVALEASQRRRQHPLRDTRDTSLQLRKPGAWGRPLLEHDDDEQAPLVADPVQHFTKLAVVMCRQRRRRSSSSRHTVPSKVTSAEKSAVLRLRSWYSTITKVYNSNHL